MFGSWWMVSEGLIDMAIDMALLVKVCHWGGL